MESNPGNEENYFGDPLTIEEQRIWDTQVSSIPLQEQLQITEEAILDEFMDADDEVVDEIMGSMRDYSEKMDDLYAYGRQLGLEAEELYGPYLYEQRVTPGRERFAYKPFIWLEAIRYAFFKSKKYGRAAISSIVHVEHTDKDHKIEA